MEEAVIVAGARTAVGRAGKGSLRNMRPDELAAYVLRGVLERTPGLEAGQIDDVILGCAFPEREQGMNVARIAALRAGYPESVPAATVNRFCSTSSQTISQAAERIMTGGADVMVAGGVESMSYIPMDATMRMTPNPELAREYPDVYLSMGLTAENLADRYGIKREHADEFALASHRKAIDAIDQGRFKEEILPIPVVQHEPDADGIMQRKEITFATDEGPRRETTLEALAGLRPAFKVHGTVTAGNSSQTSDGAAAVVVMSRRRAEALGLEPLAIYRGFQVAGVAPEVMGIGPVRAVPKLLERCGVSLDAIDLIELNEAFAVQSLAVIRELELPMDKLNVNGGAIALGHPLGCTGAKLTLTLIHELRRRGGGLGMVTMCVGGGMGAASLFEVPAG